MGSMPQLDEWEFTASQTSFFEEKRALYYRQGGDYSACEENCLSFGNASRGEFQIGFEQVVKEFTSHPSLNNKDRMAVPLLKKIFQWQNQ